MNHIRGHLNNMISNNMIFESADSEGYTTYTLITRNNNWSGTK